MTSFGYWSAWAPDGFFLCCLCFESFPITQAHIDENGQKWDVCVPCRQTEDRIAEEIRNGNRVQLGE